MCLIKNVKLAQNICSEMTDAEAVVNVIQTISDLLFCIIFVLKMKSQKFPFLTPMPLL